MKYDKFVNLRKVNREVIVPAFDRAGLNNIATSISQCGNFSVMYECMHCGTREWKGFTRCKNKFCACCNAVKSLIWIAKAYSKLEQYLKAGKYIVMLTLTIRDRSNLTESLNILNKAWKYFHDKDRKCANEFNHTFAGGIKSLEVTTGKNSGEWHPHLHCILVKDQFSYDKPYLDSAWAHCVERAGGEIDEKINDIRSIYMRDENGVKRYDKDALLLGIVESVKYISKFDYNKETFDRLKELVNSLHGVRQIDTFGCCKNIHKDVEDELNEEVQLGDIVEHACQVCGCTEAKLVEMLTDRIPSADGIVLTDKVNIFKPFTGKMLEGVKASNGKISWDSLQEPKKTDNELFEDLVYQSSMFDTECPATATSRSIRNVDNDLDKLDELFAKATEDEISKKP
jgi:hypothetical protein